MRRRLTTAAVTITDPLVKYQSLVSTGVYQPDPAQHRLALHLQKLYGRLKDYEPSPEYRERLRRVTDAVDAARAARASTSPGDDLAAPGHPIRRNPLFARFFRDDAGPALADAMALTRVLTSHQAAVEADSPRGLFLSGEVGTGKSMLLDLLADGLPTRLKRRWHFNTFMLHAFSRLEQFRREGGGGGGVSGGGGSGDPQQNYSLMWLAKEMVESSPILFLDEFQLPDRAASKLLSNLFVAFFQLGGVLVASSNRVPEELERAAGAAFTPPVVGGLVGRLLGRAAPSGRGELFGATSDFAVFLEVLKARCDFFHIEGSKDWRRLGDEKSPLTRASDTLGGVTMTEESTSSSALTPTSDAQEEGDESKASTPSKYIIKQDSEEWDSIMHEYLHQETWEPAELVVYGRRVHVPRQNQGVALWAFEDIVSSFGPADYISLASHYHTFIIDHVPVLPTSRKNEARRFITLLDALYEARCKLIVRAEAGPDDIFFPETRPISRGELPQDPSPHSTETPIVENGDATYSETIAEVYQDQQAPFRPNISAYSTELKTSKYDPDQDSDFVLEQDEKAKAVNFADAGAFTGEDERFAYRRAASRLWEMCGARWHARGGPGWWRPLPVEARHWEGSAPSTPLSLRSHLQGPNERASTDARLGPSVTLEEHAGLQRFGLDKLRKKMNGHGE